MGEKHILDSEIELKENECCIVFDFGCYFPYENSEILSFSFKWGLEEYEDIKLNKRYINKKCITISKKYDRKISKIGYPIIMKLNQQCKISLIQINIGIKENVINLIFPLSINMTKDKPYCKLSLRYNFTNHQFSFFSDKKNDNIGYNKYLWSNKKVTSKYYCLLQKPIRTNNSTLLYNDVIEVFSDDKLL